MMKRSQKGATLALVLSCIVVLAMVAYGFFVLTMTMGGSRELQHATDAGGLNVAKHAIKNPGVQLSGAEETANFSGLVDSKTKEVSLINYNRMVGQTMLVAMNAQAEDTGLAKSRASGLISTLQGDSSIGGRLTKQLEDAKKMEEHFSSVAGRNNVRMVGAEAQTFHIAEGYDTAYLDENTASNVDLHPETLPFGADGQRISLPSGSTVSDKSNRSFNYISGYAPISFSGIGQLSGVPVFPHKAPHLVSLHDFAAHTSVPTGLGHVPPNSFRTAGGAKKSTGDACSIVGALDTDFTAAIPYGYLVITNGAGASFSGTLGDDDQIFAKELMTGVYVGPGVGSNRAFTTNGNLYSQWLNYNAAKAAGQVVGQEPSRVGIKGDPTTFTAPAVILTWTDYGPNPSKLATDMLSPMQTYYNHANTGTFYSSNSLTAVEQYKALVAQAFGRVTRVHDPSDPAYIQYIQVSGQPTGMKVFDHNAVYAGVPAFGRAGSLKEFLNQTGAGKLIQFVEQRLKQIKPDASSAEINNVLNSPAIGMGARLFIYLGDDNKLTIGPSLPSGRHYEPVTPDGKGQSMYTSYDVIHKSVNAPRDGGAPVFPFMNSPMSQGYDNCKFTPSSGYKNLLGIMDFSNSVAVGTIPPNETKNDTPPSGGGGYFSDPN